MVSQKPYDIFVASSERYQDLILLNLSMNEKGKYQNDLAEDTTHIKSTAIPTGPWEKLSPNDEVDPIGRSRNANTKRALREAFWSRVSGALVGGVFLIGPMWLLALKPGLLFQLSATTVCVFAFGLLAAWYVERLEHVFSSTLAYAAVLMVFVGVVMQGSGSQKNM